MPISSGLPKLDWIALSLGLCFGREAARYQETARHVVETYQASQSQDPKKKVPPEEVAQAVGSYYSFLQFIREACFKKAGFQIDEKDAHDQMLIEQFGFGFSQGFKITTHEQGLFKWRKRDILNSGRVGRKFEKIDLFQEALNYVLEIYQVSETCQKAYHQGLSRKPFEPAEKIFFHFLTLRAQDDPGQEILKGIVAGWLDISTNARALRHDREPPQSSGCYNQITGGKVESAPPAQDPGLAKTSPASFLERLSNRLRRTG